MHISYEQPIDAGANRFASIFEALPPLDSPEYIAHLRTASAAALPAQVLAQAYRQLFLAGRDDAARVTLERLVGSDDKHRYLGSVRRLARLSVARGQYWYDADDLIQATIIEIVKVLPTPRGELAERAWVLFSQQRFYDGWRALNGRRGERVRGERVEPRIDEESGEIFDPAEETDAASAPWHVGVEESKLPWLEEFVHRTISGINDPLIRRVAEDQFGDDPSPISAGTSRSGKPPLTEQLQDFNADRFKIFRALRNAKARLAGALLAQREHELDAEWLRQFVRGKV